MPARNGFAVLRSALRQGVCRTRTSQYSTCCRGRCTGYLPMRLINRTPGRSGWLALAILPFAMLLALYLTSSAQRLELNPNDKLLPSFGQMSAAVERLAFTPDKRSGDYLFWQDTASSLKRLGTGLAIAAVAGLCLGIVAGTLPLFSAPLSPLLTVLSMVPPLAILPILFIVFGLGELSKVMLIVIGITPILARDLEHRAREIPRELLIKAQTLGANTWTLILRLVLPQLMPRLLISLRLVLASLHGDGRDPALCRLDHPTGLGHGLPAAAPDPAAVPLV